MSKNKKTAKATKQKLTAEQRSQVAKDRWAKRRAPASEPISSSETIIHTVTTNEPVTTPGIVISYADSEAISGEPINNVPFRPEPTASVWELGKDGNAVHRHVHGEELEKLRSTTPLQAPPAPKKPKRIPVPKEFSVALRAAENRLAKAITERAEYAGKLAAVNAEIPSLMQIIQALKGSQVPVPPVLHDAFNGFPGAPIQTPVPQYQAPNPFNLAAAQAPPPISRAQGGAIQFGPEVVGEGLEGPEDEDQFLTGPHAGGGWIGA